MDRIDAYNALAPHRSMAKEYRPTKILIEGGPDSGLSFVRETAMLGFREMVLYNGDYYPVLRREGEPFIKVEEA